MIVSPFLISKLYEYMNIALYEISNNTFIKLSMPIDFMNAHIPNWILFFHLYSLSLRTDILVQMYSSYKFKYLWTVPADYGLIYLLQYCNNEGINVVC